MKIPTLVLLATLATATAVAQDKKSRWVDSVFQTMKPQEKVSQLFMIPVSVNSRPAEIEELKRQLKELKVGGLYITKGSVKNYARLANQLQAITTVPLLIGINAEWGLGQTLDSAMNFQKPLVLGSLKNDSLVYALGAEIANQMKALGIYVNFAPHANIQVEKKNPFIALRYFGWRGFLPPKNGRDFSGLSRLAHFSGRARAVLLFRGRRNGAFPAGQGAHFVSLGRQPIALICLSNVAKPRG